MFASPFYLHHLAILGTFARALKIEDELLQIDTNFIPGPDWNYVSPLTDLAIHRLVNKNEIFGAIYIPSTRTCESIAGYLEENYRLAFTDAWMRFKAFAPAHYPDTLAIKEVTTSSDIEIFIHIFQLAFGGSESHEPYGKLPAEYSLAIKSSFDSSETAFTHFIAFDNNGKPVGCASVSIVNSFAFFYCLGVLPEYRRQGFAKQLQMFRVEYALKRGCTDIYLQTAKDSVNEVMNQNLGFQTVFASSCYVRNSHY